MLGRGDSVPVHAAIAMIIRCAIGQSRIAQATDVSRACMLREVPDFDTISCIANLRSCGLNGEGAEAKVATRGTEGQPWRGGRT